MWSVRAAEEEGGLLDQLDWTRGPARVQLRAIADVEVPEGFMFTGSSGTRTLLEAMGNPTNGDELGFLAPTSVVWFVVFEFSDVGYVKDDDRDELNPDAMLKSIKEGNEYGNEERRRMGVPPLNIIGWEYPPKYDPTSNNLEWAIRAESEGQPVVNYNTRLLGRKGVMEVSLVIGPDELSATIPAFKSLLAGYTFQEGEKYAEYREGDKLAKYGLAALVVGGAAAGAAKLGLFAWLAVFLKKAWKLVVLGVAAIGAFFKKLIFGRDRRVETEPEPE